MSRDSSGTYSLPSGNPVVTGTIIESDWANTTMNDVAAALTDSLSRTGNGSMLVAFKEVDGSESNPSYSFTNSTNSGIYRDGITGEVCITVNGVTIGRFKEGVNQGLTIDGQVNASSITYNGLLLEDGSAAAPAYSFQNETDTGMYLESTQQELRFSLLGTDAIVVSSTGTHITGTLTSDAFGLSTLAVEDGSAALPSFTFQNGTDTGLYYDVGTDELRITIGGVDQAQFSSAGLNINNALTVGSFALNNVRTDDGAAGAPSHSFTNGTSTGMYFNDSTNDLYLSRSGVNRLRVHATGVEIIGLVSATGGFDVGTALVDNGSISSPSFSFTNDPNTGLWVTPNTALHFGMNGSEKFELTAAGAEVFGALNVTSTLTTDGALGVNLGATIGGVVSGGSFTTTGTIHAGDDLTVGANFTVTENTGTITDGIWQGDAIDDAYLATIDTANKVALSALDIDGGTAMTSLVDGDLFIVDDGAGGTNRKITAENVKNYMNSAPQVLAAVRFNASTGTPVINKSFNVSSITDLGVGHFRINFTSNLPDTNYYIACATSQVSADGNNSAPMINPLEGTAAVDSVDIFTYIKGNSGGTATDPPLNSVICYG